jgi:segregation and condensation protein A
MAFRTVWRVVMGINVKLQAFEGPLDLLLHLIDKNKVNIYDIPISMITDQYMEYIDQMDKEDLNVVSEFLVMAATLLDIKSRMLLPKEVNEEGEEEDPRAELVEKLLEYKLFKYMSYELKDRQVDAQKAFYKDSTVPPEVNAYRPPINMEELIGDITLAKLNAIFQDVMKRKEDKVDPIRSKFGKIQREEVSMSDKLVQVKNYLKNNKKFSFHEMLLEAPSKMSVIVTFLVVLELIKTGFVTAEQENTMADINICVIKDPELIQETMEE